MRPLDWLRAQRRGEIAHDWNPIVIERAGRRLQVMVSTDAARVNGYRENIGARGAQLLADALGGIMPTAVIMAERHRQATVKIAPVLGDILHMTAEQHSDLVDRALYVAQGTDGPWIVSDIGKPWILDRLSAPAVAICEGFFVDGDVPRGIYGYAEAAGVLAVRVPSELTVRHPLIRAGRHDLHQGDGDPTKPTDYSPKLVVALDACQWFADGDGDEPTGAADWLSRIYSDPIDCAMVSPDGKPLPARQPGVEPLKDSPEWKQLLAEEEHQPPDTERSHALSAPAVVAVDAAVAAPGPRRLTAVKTPPSLGTMWEEMTRATPELTRAGRLVLMAQWFGETGGGRAMWCHNVGNFKARVGRGTDWCFFVCNELLTPAQTAQAIATAPPREPLTAEQIAWFKKRTGHDLDPAGGPSAVKTGTQAGYDVVWFFPPHPYACFAAFRSLADGVRWYVDKMRTRFAAAWPAVVAGDVALFGHLLKLAHYYTALEAEYVGGLQFNFAYLARNLPAD